MNKLFDVELVKNVLFKGLDFFRLSVVAGDIKS